MTLNTNIWTMTGALLFALWGILHIWVGFEGLSQYWKGGTIALWNMVIGGRAVPRGSFHMPTDEATSFGQGRLVLNFTMDVGASGVLGLFVGWMMWTEPGWLAFGLGTIVIGIVDLSFLFLLVMGGVIERSFPVLLGPVVWFAAVASCLAGLLAR